MKNNRTQGTITRAGMMALIFLVLLTGCWGAGGNDVQAGAKNPAEIQPEVEPVPTLFIHGFKGGKGSFGGMLSRFAKADLTKKWLILTIGEDGAVHAEEKGARSVPNPSVQVIFENNRSDEFSQAKWIKAALAFLRQEYAIEKVNLVGHSMGGVSSLRYLIEYGQDEHLPSVEKYAAIAAPFNYFNGLEAGETIQQVLERGPQDKSDRIAAYKKGMEHISAALPVFIIAGDVEGDTEGDGVLPLATELSVYYLFELHGNPVRQQVFTGKNAQHSALHENEAVDQALAAFLWNTAG